MRRCSIVAALLLGLICAGPAQARPAVAVTTGNQLVAFDTSIPAAATMGHGVTGLQPGEVLLGIDYRPANGKLYGLGSTSRLYTVNAVTGRAAQVGAPFATPLSGTHFGFDFTPVADRIRVVSDTGQNFRLNPDSAVQANDVPLNPAGTVGAIAYSEDYDGASASTLYGIDTSSDSTVRIGGANGSPTPNGGTVTTVGALGVAAPAAVSLDISYPAPVAFAAIGGALYTVDVEASGAATLVGQISGTPLAIAGIAVASMDPALLMLLSANLLAEVRPSMPGTGAPVGGTVALNPQFPEVFDAIDFRPATGELYGLGAASHVAKIDPETGDWTAVGPAFTPALSTNAAFGAGFDFLASEDRIRVTTDADQNLRLDPDTGQVALIGPSISPGTSSVTAVAGDHNAPGAGTSSALAIDASTARLVRIEPNGTLATVGSLGLISGPPSVDGRASLDVVEPGLGFADVIDPFLGGHQLYLVDLVSGRARLIGVTAPAAATVYPVGLAVVPRGQFRNDAATPSATEAAGHASLVVRRAAGSEGRATVEYATADGSATGGQDYTPVTGVLDFASGETTKTVDVPIADDAAVEGPETFTLTLTDATNGTSVAPDAAAITIQSDDVAPAPLAGASGTAGPPPTPGAAATATSVPDSSIGRTSAVARAGTLRAFEGTASDADGDLAHVDVAVVRLTGGARAARAGCQELQVSGRLKTVKLVRGRCRPSTFLRTTGGAHWRLRLRHTLPPGSYVVYARAVDRAGRSETSFSAADGNRRAFRLT